MKTNVSAAAMPCKHHASLLDLILVCVKLQKLSQRVTVGKDMKTIMSINYMLQWFHCYSTVEAWRPRKKEEVHVI